VRLITAQGVANTVTGFFGGMGGCAMIGPSIINVKSGGRTRIAGICAAVLQAIEAVAGQYPAAGKRLQLRHLTRDCHRMLNKAGHLMVDSDDDPDYGLAVDDDPKTGVLGGAMT